MSGLNSHWATALLASSLSAATVAWLLAAPEPSSQERIASGAGLARQAVAQDQLAGFAKELGLLGKRLQVLEQRDKIANAEASDVSGIGAMSGFDAPVELQAERVDEFRGPGEATRSDRIEQAGLTPEEFDDTEKRYQALYRKNFEQEWLERRERFLAAQTVIGPREQMRGELGDDGFDRYLYATGSANRVRVRTVMAGSAAADAGLQPGDLILAYGGERVFDFQDLRRSSYEGSPGENIILEVRREDGTIEQVLAVRGPLGISSGRGASEVPE